jgi:hypothetical protein
MRCLLVLITIICTAAICVPCRAVTVDPPIRIEIRKLDRSQASGRIISYDEDGFQLMDAQKQTTTVKWEELPPDTIMNLNDRLVRKGSGDGWFKLGQKLLTMPGGRAPAERAFQKALRLDPNLKGQIEEARKQAKLHPPAPVSTTPGPDAVQSDPNLPQGDTAAQPPGAVNEPRDPARPVVGPQEVGQVDPSAWGKQSPEQQAQSIAQLKQFAQRSAQTLRVNLAPYETQYFLFYSDLQPVEAQKWAGVLDRMYVQLSQLFGIPKNTNIWKGKALVLVFSREQDYLNFEMQMHDKTMASGTAGMCHCFGNGIVHIAFYRQPNELDFAHVLVHESVHGFLHRYRSPVPIPSWINEGLAETIASQMVLQRGAQQSGDADARADLQKRKNMDDFFTSDHIVAWQYPVARTLTEFMIRQNKRGYVEFINGIKDGMTWEDALQDKYGVTLDQLVNAYGISMTVANLKPSRQGAQSQQGTEPRQGTQSQQGGQ